MPTGVTMPVSAGQWGVIETFAVLMLLTRAASVALFLLALIAYRRWRVPIGDLERLIRLCHPGRRSREARHCHRCATAAELRKSDRQASIGPDV
jgi:hypothetical protein